MSDITLKEHLKNVRIKAHETQKKNGHFAKMAKAAKICREKNKDKKA